MMNVAEASKSRKTLQAPKAKKVEFVVADSTKFDTRIFNPHGITAWGNTVYRFIKNIKNCFY